MAKLMKLKDLKYIPIRTRQYAQYVSGMIKVASNIDADFMVKHDIEGHMHLLTDDPRIDRYARMRGLNIATCNIYDGSRDESRDIIVDLEIDKMESEPFRPIYFSEDHDDPTEKMDNDEALAFFISKHNYLKNNK